MELFGLELAQDNLTAQETSLGIWNGNEFVYKDNGGSGLWNLAKMFWKYGLAPYRAKKHVSTVINKFLGMYEQIPFESLEDTARRLDLLEATNLTGFESYSHARVSELFSRDVINAATRVNYAQELENINGLLGAVSFVTDDSIAVKGGNWQMFSHMIARSQASLQLNHSIRSITKKEAGCGWSVCTSNNICEDFGQVVIATPLSLSKIEIDPPFDYQIVEYVKLHVTILATQYRLSPHYFGTDQVPASILTTKPVVGDAPEFQSLSIVGKVKGSDGLLIYKIFSKSMISDAWLSKVFLFPRSPKEDTSFLYRHLWDAYPVSTTTTQFDSWEQGEPLSGLWYLNGMERFISTMETATLAGRNVAGLIHQRLLEHA